MTADPQASPLSVRDMAVLERISNKVVAMRLSAAAVLFLESVRPLSFLGSQAMVFFGPVIQSVFGGHQYDAIRRTLEHRDGIETLIRLIESAEADRLPGPQENSPRDPTA